MSRQQPRSTASSATAPGTRMNEYFVPRDGIDREVISADICRYLGNDALVRPGHYDNPQTGQTVQGYYITAYRNLTTAMIEDLKADSARWDNERRAQTSRSTAGGIQTSRNRGPHNERPSSNLNAVQYRYSETHQSRQHHGPTEHPPYQQQQPDSYSGRPRDSFDGAVRYTATNNAPGYNAPGYNTSSPFSQPPNYAPSNTGPPGYANYQPLPSASNPDPRYPSPANQPNMMNPGYQNQEAPYINTGANMNMTPRGYPPDGFSAPRNGSSAPGSQQPIYATSGPVQQGYPQPSVPYQYSNHGPPHPGNGQQYSSSIPPQDSFFGRASPAGQPQPIYGSQGQQQQQQQQQPQHQPHQPHQPQQHQQHPQQQQYDDLLIPRSSATPSSPKPPPGANKRRSDQESDRNSVERHHRPPPSRR